jgi:hypothetical protein
MERDSLTKTVLETFHSATSELATLPSEITDMLGALPLEVKKELEEQWSPDQRQELLAEVQAIILDSLQRKGVEDA